MTVDKIITCLFVSNAMINTFLILQSDNRLKKTENFGSSFWRMYLFIVPFFVTRGIIKEIEKKKMTKINLITRDYERLTKAWKLAANDLKIKIQTPFVIKQDRGKEIRYAVLIESFGNKLGTVICSNNELLDFEFPKEYGYHCKVFSPFVTYHREVFIDVLNEWGFYGEPSEKPSWYTGDSETEQ